MTIIIDTDRGPGIERSFIRLATADGSQFGTVGIHPMIWSVSDSVARRHGVPNALDHENCHFEVDKNLSLEECAIKHLSAFFPEVPQDRWKVEPLNIPIGSYFPRMARPHHQHPTDFPTQFPYNDFAHERAAAAIQASTLSTSLHNCFDTVDPDNANMKTFGTNFRNILILASTEFEAQCKGILRANQYNGNSNTTLWRTSDYVKLEEALRLKDYSIRFVKFPWLRDISPFSEWIAEKPTRSLPWYDAYNKTKHDRETSFQLANLENAIAAVAAVIVICVAQFGVQFLRKHSSLSDVFAIENWPVWSIGNSHGWLSDDRENEVAPTNYPFP